MKTEVKKRRNFSGGDSFPFSTHHPDWQRAQTLLTLSCSQPSTCRTVKQQLSRLNSGHDSGAIGGRASDSAGRKTGNGKPNTATTFVSGTPRPCTRLWFGQVTRNVDWRAAKSSWDWVSLHVRELERFAVWDTGYYTTYCTGRAVGAVGRVFLFFFFHRLLGSCCLTLTISVVYYFTRKLR